MYRGQYAHNHRGINTNYQRENALRRAQSAPPPRTYANPEERVPLPRNVTASAAQEARVIDKVPGMDRVPGSHSANKHRSSPKSEPISGFDRESYYREQLPVLKKHANVYRGEFMKVWIPDGARNIVDTRNPPDECYWPAFRHTNRSLDEFTRNSELHQSQTELFQALSIAQDQYDKFFEQYYRASVAYKRALNKMSSWALAIANERWYQYTKCYTRCSNNRGRYLELNAYWYLSLGP